MSAFAAAARSVGFSIIAFAASGVYEKKQMYLGMFLSFWARDTVHRQ
jgi:hypothetical protein